MISYDPFSSTWGMQHSHVRYCEKKVAGKPGYGYPMSQNMHACVAKCKQPVEYEEVIMAQNAESHGLLVDNDTRCLNHTEVIETYCPLASSVAAFNGDCDDPSDAERR